MNVGSLITEDDRLILAEVVTEGALFLDALTAGEPPAERWYWLVNPEALDMRAIDCGCVLSQIDPSRMYSPPNFGIDYFEARLLGFNLSHSWSRTQRPVAWKVLRDLWREHIYDRRAADLLG